VHNKFHRPDQISVSDQFFLMNSNDL
jgi:hypothetical protein